MENYREIIFALAFVAIKVVASVALGLAADRVAFGKSKTHASYQIEYRRAAVIVAIAAMVMFARP